LITAGQKNNVAAVAGVTAIGAAFIDKFFVPKIYFSVATVTSRDHNFDFIYKTHTPRV